MSLANQLRLGARAIFGVDVQRHNARTDHFLRLAEIFRQRGIRFVLDVGANDGGYGMDLMTAGYGGRIASFEPLPDVRPRLMQLAAMWAGRWQVPPPMALSDRESVQRFNIAGNSVSSSLLDMTQTHVAASPKSAPTSQIQVNTKRLDQVWPALDAGDRAFLKIDTQGSERLVLDGAGDLLKGPIVGLQLEMSLGTLYRGQMLAHEMDAYVRGLGFVLWDLIPGFRDPKSFRILQYDGIYFREP